MQLFHTLTILGLSCLSSTLADLAHSTVYKSFPSALHECVGYLEVSNCTRQWISEDSYPNVDEMQRLIHCTLVNLGAWNHDTNKARSHVLQSFFHPKPGDCCYKERTRECLNRINSSDHYERVYESFLCYNQNYGNLRDSDQYIPFEQNELLQTIETAFTIQGLPRRTLEQFSRGKIRDDPQFSRVHLTWAVRVGYYSLQSGLNIHAAYVQFGHPELLTGETQQCCDAAVKEECDFNHATKLNRIFRNCLKDIIPTLELFQTAACCIVNKYVE